MTDLNKCQCPSRMSNYDPTTMADKYEMTVDGLCLSFARLSPLANESNIIMLPHFLEESLFYTI